jgi:hypothetical protein
MAINKGDIPFIGTSDGICGYWRHGINIIRKSTPLEGSRVKKDPAFKGFRKSGSRMKEASPIAAVLYNQIPKEQKIYCLYRLLTGEALKMLAKNDLYDKNLIPNGEVSVPYQVRTKSVKQRTWYGLDRLRIVLQ